MSFLTPLAISFLFTGVLVAISDFSTHKVHDYLWLPALAGLAWFFLNFNVEFFALTAIFPVAAVSVFWVANRTAKQKAGDADLIAIGVFTMWTGLGMLAFVGAVCVGYVGRKLRFWNVGSRGIPLAGLMGAAMSFLTLFFL